MTIWAVKFGGSLASDAAIPLWLEHIADFPDIIIPGGGPFANLVRHSQSEWNFNETTAHWMAVLAMQQFGYLLQGVQPRLKTGIGIHATLALSRAGYTSVWHPQSNELDVPELAPGWDITSDSLALWLSCRLGIKNLLLVKAFPLDSLPNPCNIEMAIKLNIIDSAFHRLSAESPVPRIWLCNGKMLLNYAVARNQPDAYFTPLLL